MGEVKRGRKRAKPHHHKYLGDDSDMVCIAPGKCLAKHLTKVRMSTGYYDWVLVIDETPMPSKREARRKRQG